MYVHLHVHIYTYTYTCTYTHTYAHAQTRTHIHTYIHTYIHTHTDTYTHKHTHTHIHKHIHTYIHPEEPLKAEEAHVRVRRHVRVHKDKIWLFTDTHTHGTELTSKEYIDLWHAAVASTSRESDAARFCVTDRWKRYVCVF
jgi:hypothetical protein